MAIDFCEDQRARIDWIKVSILPSQEPPADKMANGAYSNLVNRVDVVTKTASMHWIEVANLRELLLA